MAAYIIADVIVTDAAKMAAYREWSTKAMQEHGVEVLVRGGDIGVLEGSWSPQRVVVLKFADSAAARAYYDSQTYSHARQVREGAGVINMIVVDGV
jgi:uncharacterized protein (DUF1330 family)